MDPVGQGYLPRLVDVSDMTTSLFAECDEKLVSISLAGTFVRDMSDIDWGCCYWP